MTPPKRPLLQILRHFDAGQHVKITLNFPRGGHDAGLAILPREGLVLPDALNAAGAADLVIVNAGFGPASSAGLESPMLVAFRLNPALDPMMNSPTKAG